MRRDAQSAVFGKRREPHTFIIARGDDIRHFTVKPWLASLSIGAVAALAVGYLAATSYLVFRDDLIGASAARQARLQQDYEDRISALRTQVDRITSRQMLDQQLVESQVAKLLEQQSLLTERHGRLEPAHPEQDASALPRTVAPPASRPDTLSFAEPPLESEAFASLRMDAPQAQSAADRADIAFVSINRSLRDIESTQLARLDTWTNDAFRAADTITTALSTAGLAAGAGEAEGGIGGPFIPVAGTDAFDAKVRELDAALEKLDAAKAKARRLPLEQPAPDRPMSSTFGVRADPLLGTPAMHSGIDFRAPAGFPAQVTAAGTVVRAGWNGGYGQMVEVEHGGGYSTRYAHLSRIDVSEGQKLEAGAVVGAVGSTGRSTGPHLHYEVRRNGEAIDPLRFLRAGRKIGRLLGDG